jgi:hypothetical protein
MLRILPDEDVAPVDPLRPNPPGAVVRAAIITMPIPRSEVGPKTALTCRRRGAIREQVDTLLP